MKAGDVSAKDLLGWIMNGLHVVFAVIPAVMYFSGRISTGKGAFLFLALQGNLLLADSFEAGDDLTPWRKLFALRERKEKLGGTVYFKMQTFLLGIGLVSAALICENSVR